MSPSETMFQELQWLSFTKRIQYHTFIMMYKAFNGQTPTYITEMFTKVSEIHNRNLRSSEITQSFEFRLLKQLTSKTHFLSVVLNYGILSQLKLEEYQILIHSKALSNYICFAHRSLSISTIKSFKTLLKPILLISGLHTCSITELCSL